jgi:hypothetical protein
MSGITRKRSGERLLDRRLAGERAADRLGPARQAEHAVLGEKRHDTIDIAAVERGGDRFHQVQSYHHTAPKFVRARPWAGHPRKSARPANSASWMAGPSPATNDKNFMRSSSHHG